MRLTNRLHAQDKVLNITVYKFRLKCLRCVIYVPLGPALWKATRSDICE